MANDDGKRPYDVGPDGQIHFHPGKLEDFRQMFADVNVDIETVRTEAEFERAFRMAGDYLFAKIVEEAKNGEPYAIDFIRAYLRHDYSEAQAIIGRQTFEVIPGGRINDDRCPPKEDEEEGEESQ